MTRKTKCRAAAQRNGSGRQRPSTALRRGRPAELVFVNSYTTRAQTDPRVTPLDESRFVIVWRSEGSPDSDSDGFSIQGQRFH
jgi:hypothetical protein